MKLQGKTALVTGASSGMGKEITRLFLEEGAFVAALDIREDRLQALKEEMPGSERLSLYPGDVSNPQSMEEAIRQIMAERGSLDILVNNAGIMDEMMPVGEVSDELWDRVLGVNLRGPMVLTRAFLREMLPKGGGVIINVASVGGLFGHRAGAAYTASKFALVGLTKNTAFSYAQQGIRCNAIAPGAVATDIGAGIRNPSPLGMERAMAGIGANPRQGEPAEIAKVALFLASDDSSFVNGAVITADAGWTAY